MYRRSLQQKKMETDHQYQFLHRFGSLPVMETAVAQLTTIYSTTKSKNSLIKYTLEATEYGVGKVVTTTKPIVERLEKPIESLDSFACNQLTKLESNYPIIGKPTDEVLQETKKLYNNTVGPTVDKVTSVKDYSINTVTSVKDYGVNTASAVKDYGVNTASAVKDYGVNTANAVKDYSANTVSGVKNYTMGKLDSVKRYSVEKLTSALDTSYGKVVVECVDGLLDNTEKYVDYYLPEEDEKEGEKDPEKEETNTLIRTVNLSNKVRQRMFTKAMRDFQNIQKRSKETVDNMTFTVDLIQYAKSHIDGVTGGVTERMTSAKQKLSYIWEEINKNEEQVASEETNEVTKPSQVNAVTMERRLIATARHLTLRLKRGINAASGTISTVSGRVLPTAVQNRLAQALKYTDDLYSSFSQANNFQELPTHVLDHVKDKLGYITESVNFATEYITNLTVVDWLAQNLKLKEIKTAENKQEAEVEMEEIETPAPATSTKQTKKENPEKPKAEEEETIEAEKNEQPKEDKNREKKSKKKREHKPVVAVPEVPTTQTNSAEETHPLPAAAEVISPPVTEHHD